MISYWEKESFTNYDYAVIGGGIVGLSTAISLREKSKDARILVIERGLRPTGASTRNAGFACFGSLSELHEDMLTMGDDNMVKLVELRWKGIKKLIDRVGIKNLKFEDHGGYELLRKPEMHYLDSIDRVNDLLHPIFGEPVFTDESRQLTSLGVDDTIIKGMLYNKFEGQLHAGEMMRHLWALAAELRIEIITGARVKRLENNGKNVRLALRGSLDSDKIGIRAGKVAVCTNGFTRSLFPEIKLEPGRGQVIVTEPINDLKFKGCYHMDRGFYYFRNVEDRILFGGGRNLQMKEETTTEFGENEIILETLKGYLENILIPGQQVKIDRSWSGIMAFGNTKKPIIQEQSPNVFIGVRLGGMGVAIGSTVGEKLSELMTSN